MQENRKKNSSGLCISATVAVLLLFGANDAAAKEWEMANTPPPMPKSMQRPGTGNGSLLTLVPTENGRTTRVDGKSVIVRESLANDVGFVVPDANNDYVWVPAPPKTTPPSFADARELRLKVRELTAQLIAGMDPALCGLVALPTSFVSQDDFSQSSPLGRFMAEQLMYEFNQRGFPVREYRMASSLTTREGQGEFLLSRKTAPISTKNAKTVFVVGTYLLDRHAVFLNARLVRGDGEVLRTAQLVLPGNSMARRMVAGGGKTLKRGSLPILDYKTTTQPTNLTPFDLGEDVH